MENRKNDLMIAAGIGIGGFILGFITAKITGRKFNHLPCDSCVLCGADECDYDCDNCDDADGCEFCQQ